MHIKALKLTLTFPAFFKAWSKIELNILYKWKYTVTSASLTSFVWTWSFVLLSSPIHDFLNITATTLFIFILNACHLQIKVFAECIWLLAVKATVCFWLWWWRSFLDYACGGSGMTTDGNQSATLFNGARCSAERKRIPLGFSISYTECDVPVSAWAISCLAHVRDHY